ncbi:PREDICTED: uncharacterized protein LOC109177284 [Ipomoea nil]|uniref:uncharacterized protein LOC109177284 n=1 Tax=Ipomoea nil TaxID=35883 RepID=UPI000901E9F5|nr:PREDICTED: uncharacterized protein LOC109177284 [Ipomoea nil]
MEWSFLEGMLGALGLDQEWVDLLMSCVSSVSYSIQVNWEVVGTVDPTRGIRQGDPLSPYLFIICAEALSLLLQKAEASGAIHGVRVARGAPTVSHLFFANDSLLFFRANHQEAMTIKEYLDLYNAVSGQLINYDKSSAVFSLNTTPDQRTVVSACIGVCEASDLGKYLGLPSVLGRNKTATFRYVEEKVQERIDSWQHRFLSKAGKGVLLKSIAQALPIFTMSTFLLSVRVCATIEKLFNRYWWGGGGVGTRGIHWLSWNRLCNPKSKGGLGFRKLHEFNVALLAKQGWRLMIHPESLVSRMLKAKYFPKCDFMEASAGNNPSYIWRSILARQEVLKLGVARRLGDGRNTRIWGWGWLADTSNPNLITPYTEHLKDAMVVVFASTSESQELHVAVRSRGLWREEDVLQGQSLQQFMEAQMSSANGEQAVMMAVIFWTFWMARNHSVWRQITPAVESMRVQLDRLMALWKESYVKGDRPRRESNDPDLWEPPPHNTLKCNVDAAMFSSSAGFGAIVCDHEGHFVAALVANSCAPRARLWLRF